MILFWVLSLFLPTQSEKAVKKEASSTLIVDILNIKHIKGDLHVGLFKPCKEFPGNCRPSENQVIAVDKNTMRLTFVIQPGDYAVAVFQDVNKNGQMDKKLFGIPKEPYGFSNNFRPVFSGPSFDDCRVQIGKAGKQISIKLN